MATIKDLLAENSWKARFEIKQMQRSKKEGDEGRRTRRKEQKIEFGQEFQM